MCLSIFLLADRALPVSLDATYPSLNLHPVEAEYQHQTLDGIQRVASAAFVYSVSPAGYCGCYFGYETLREFEASMAERAANPHRQYAGTPEEAEIMWRSRVEAVNSLGSYLSAHSETRLALYAVWEHCAGQKDPVRVEVPPSYFGGPGFDRLPEDILLTIVPELAADENPEWDTDAQRTHQWFDDGSGCCE